MGVVIGYTVVVWRVPRGTARDIEAIGEVHKGRLEAREHEVGRPRDGYDKSQWALATYERRVRYLESAPTTSPSGSDPQQTPPA